MFSLTSIYFVAMSFYVITLISVVFFSLEFTFHLTKEACLSRIFWVVVDKSVTGAAGWQPP